MNRLIMSIAVATLVYGCGSDGSSTEDKVAEATDNNSTIVVGNDAPSGSSSGAGFVSFKKEFDYTQLFIDSHDQVIFPELERFNQAAASLAAAVPSSCATLTTANLNTEIGPWQDQWRQAMSDWQRAELYWVGPLADNENALRNRIYSFETTAWADPCAVDIAVVAAESADFDITRRSNTARGLDALEYLLFNDDLNTACSAAVPQTQTWNALPADERVQKRCEYAALVAEDIRANGQALVDAFAIDYGNYRSRFINSANASFHLKQLSDALFYIEKETKDAKLGKPLGFVECASRGCPNAVESRFAAQNAAHIADNLRAFKQLFNGGKGVGFDDLIAFEGFPEVANSINQKVDAALMLAEQLTTSDLKAQAQLQLDDNSEALKNACVADSLDPDNTAAANQNFCHLHGLVRRISDQMRTDFVTIVNVDLPDRAQSDND